MGTSAGSDATGARSADRGVTCRTVVVATTVSRAAAAAGLRSECGWRSKAGQRAPDTSRRSRLPGGQRHAIGRSVTTWSDGTSGSQPAASHHPAADGARAMVVGDVDQRDDHVVPGAIAAGGHGRHRTPGDLDCLRQRRRGVAEHVAAVLGRLPRPGTRPPRPGTARVARRPARRPGPGSTCSAPSTPSPWRELALPRLVDVQRSDGVRGRPRLGLPPSAAHAVVRHPLARRHGLTAPGRPLEEAHQPLEHPWRAGVGLEIDAVVCAVPHGMCTHGPHTASAPVASISRAVPDEKSSKYPSTVNTGTSIARRSGRRAAQ